MNLVSLIGVGGGFRQSNLELLRILSTFFIIFIHANFWSLGSPNAEDAQTIDGILRVLFESLGIVAVNCFVFISAWFGISFKIKGLFSFVFQCLFVYVFMDTMLYLFMDKHITLANIKGWLFTDNWYILSYMTLYILSPVLNSYIVNADRNQLKRVVILIFVFAITLGNFSASAFNSGYSGIWFICLYLLVRYIRIYKPKFSQLSMSADLLIYLILSIMQTFLYILHIPFFGFDYTNVLIVFSSLFLALVFTKIHVENAFINWFAAGSFAAYLVHTTPSLRSGIFQTYFQQLHSGCSTVVFWSLTFLSIIITMVFARILDLLRKYTFRRFCRLINLE